MQVTLDHDGNFASQHKRERAKEIMRCAVDFALVVRNVRDVNHRGGTLHQNPYSGQGKLVRRLKFCSTLNLGSHVAYWCLATPSISWGTKPATARVSLTLYPNEWKNCRKNCFFFCIYRNFENIF